jgi:hypothetical protein
MDDDAEWTDLAAADGGYGSAKDRSVQDRPGLVSNGSWPIQSSGSLPIQLCPSSIMP